MGCGIDQRNAAKYKEITETETTAKFYPQSNMDYF
jgi:hypothetical protein